MLDAPQRARRSARREAGGRTRPLVAILAGGAGRRLGGGKAVATLAGRPLLSYPIEATQAASLEAIVVAKPDTPLPDSVELDVPVLVEPRQPLHPLVGILAALVHAKTRPVVVIGCDMPFLTPELLACLADRAGSAVVELGGRIQPLIARHEQASRGALEAALARESALTATIGALGYERVDERRLARFGDPERLCFNVNRPEDLAIAERWLCETQRRD
jgi:molybdopterin-guanine dinucleotide biosynthesis protein A